MPHEMSARRLRIRKLFKFLVFTILGLLVIFFAASFLLVRSLPARSKSVIGYLNKDEVVFVVFDKYKKRFTFVHSPSDVIISASHKKGDWPVKSLVKLGIDEGIESLFANSVTHSMKIPVNGWSGSEVVEILDGNIVLSLRRVFQHYPFGSLTLGDRLDLLRARFSYTQNPDVDLTATGYVYQMTGSLSYRVRDRMPVNLVGNFAEEIDPSEARVVIKDATGDYIQEDLIASLSSLGMYVVNVEKMQVNDNDCTVLGTSALAARAASVLMCELDKASDDSGRIIILVGKAFAERF